MTLQSHLSRPIRSLWFPAKIAVVCLLAANPATSSADVNWSIELTNPIQAAVPGGTNHFYGHLIVNGQNVSVTGFSLKWEDSTVRTTIRARPALEFLATKFVVPPAGYKGDLFTVQVPETVPVSVKASGSIYIQLDDGASSRSFQLPFVLDPNPPLSPPHLLISFKDGHLEVSWLGDGTSFVIETTENISTATQWNRLTLPITKLNGTNSVTLQQTSKLLVLRVARNP